MSLREGTMWHREMQSSDLLYLFLNEFSDSLLRVVENIPFLQLFISS